MGAGGRFNAGRFNAGRFAAGGFGVSGITGSPPVLDPIFVGDTLADVVTTGSANPPAGETFTGASPINEQNIDGAGWVAYVSSTAPTLGQTVQVRQTWETVEGSTRTFTSVERTVQAVGDALLIEGTTDALLIEGTTDRILLEA